MNLAWTRDELTVQNSPEAEHSQFPRHSQFARIHADVLLSLHDSVAWRPLTLEGNHILAGVAATGAVCQEKTF